MRNKKIIWFRVLVWQIDIFTLAHHRTWRLRRCTGNYTSVISRERGTERYEYNQKTFTEVTPLASSCNSLGLRKRISIIWYLRYGYNLSEDCGSWLLSHLNVSYTVSRRAADHPVCACFSSMGLILVMYPMEFFKHKVNLIPIFISMT